MRCAFAYRADAAPVFSRRRLKPPLALDDGELTAALHASNRQPGGAA